MNPKTTLTKTEQVALALLQSDTAKGGTATQDEIMAAFEQAYLFLDVSKGFSRHYS